MISALSLTHFKAFRHLSLPIRPLTLLTGLNSSGKSTVLNSLALLRQSIVAESSSAVLNGPLLRLGTAEDVLNEDAADETVAITITTSDGRVHRNDFAAKGRADVLPRIGASEPPPLPLSGTTFQYLRADRLGPETVSERSFEEVLQRRSLGSRGEFTSHFLAHYRDAPVANASVCIEQVGGHLLDQVTAWLSLVSPGVRIELDELTGTDFVRLRFGFGRASGLSGTSAYRSTHVGFGLTYVLPILVGCVSTPPGGLLLIENPEAHLHPQGQFRLARLLAVCASGGVQVIVETHSDHILNGLRVAVKLGDVPAHDVALHYFRQGAPGEQPSVDSPVIDDDGYVSQWPEGFFDQWDKALDALIG